MTANNKALVLDLAVQINALLNDKVANEEVAVAALFYALAERIIVGCDDRNQVVRKMDGVMRSFPAVVLQRFVARQRGEG